MAMEKTDKSNKGSLIRIFIKEIENLSGRPFLVDSERKVGQLIESIIRERDVSIVAIGKDPIIEELDLKALLKRLGVKLLPSHPGVDDPNVDEKGREFRREIEKAHLGISGVELAIADSGTIFIRHQWGMERSISLVPPIHIAILKKEQIVLSIEDLIPFFRKELDEKGKLGSCYTFITGPSRTADIEQTLILGAHGPKELFVIILDYMTPDGK
jgi:L-lactate dehydrogenase complex protein LldG